MEAFYAVSLLGIGAKLLCSLNRVTSVRLVSSLRPKHESHNNHMSINSAANYILYEKIREETMYSPLFFIEMQDFQINN